MGSSAETQHRGGDRVTAGLQEEFGAQRRFLWGLSYRMLGDAAEADDVVQDTFARALERPPPDTSLPWRPWLVRVAMNLCRDRLRARKERPYPSYWLPQPVPDERLDLATNPLPEARYALMETVSLAFLVVLERLSPQQRAVLLLRDAYGYSVHATSAALAMSEANVKTTLHRARHAMAGFDRVERPLPRELSERTREALMRMVTALASNDSGELERLLIDDVRLMGDGGGVYAAGRRPILGRSKATKVLQSGGAVLGGPTSFALCQLNGQPAVVTTFTPTRSRFAPVVVLMVEVDDGGRVRSIFSITAPQKLAAVGPLPAGSDPTR
jgi:RNA polymerase sigma-70 factor (ECF subfamily)